ncbi:MAG: 4-hydroxythreonine-4-phosphate dehydrogenase PdxA [Phycisphaerales bacterium]
MTIRPRIAICTGDPNGIGPEVVAKAIADRTLQARAELIVLDTFAGSGGGRDLGRPTAAGGRASFEAVAEAIDRAKLPPADPRAVEAIVTAPISKEAWHLAGRTYPGHTELLAESFQSPRSAMLFVGPALRVILVTVHVSLRQVSELITRERVLEAIELGAQSCRELGVPSPRVAVCGLNPHAGENGLFGPEDDREIAPAITVARAAGIDATGPYPGDAVFIKAAAGGFDLVVAMYHDQGLIPVKLIDRAKTVNVTVGLRWGGRPMVRTSPAHGTAFDIAGQNLADATSMVAAIDLAIRLVN